MTRLLAALVLVCAVAGVAAAQDAGVPGDAGAPDAGPIVVDGPDLLGLARPQASAAAAPSRVRLGDTLTLFVEVVYDEKVTVNLPATLDLDPYFEETRRSSSDERRTDGTRKRTFQVQLRAWELGDLRIPPIQVGYTAGGQQSWVVTNTVPVEVVGSLADVDDKTALLGDTPPVSLRSRDWRLPIAVAAALLVLVVALVGWRLLRKKPPALTPAVQFVPPVAFKTKMTGPAERALAAIDALEQQGTCVSDPRVGYDELVGIMRTFATEQFGVPILDRTTDELLRALARMMPRPAHTMARRWFARCDLVKYAAERPERDRSDQDLAGARAVVIAAVTPAAPPAPKPPGPEEQVAHG
jgi:hypothetical protein